MSGQLVLFGILLAAGCSGEEGFRPPVPPSTIEELQAIQPAGYSLPREGVVSAPPEEDVDFLASLKTGVPRDELRKQVALRKLLAVKALEEEEEFGFELKLDYRRALAQALIKRKFEVEHTPDTVPLETWEEVFHHPHVFPLFDHFDSYFVVDVQIICCRGDFEVCKNDRAFHVCMEEAQPWIEEAWEVLKSKNITDPEKLREVVHELAASSIPDLRMQEYSFQYNFALPHDKQRGYKVVNENVARAARSAKLREVTKPVRSNHGWHILFVKEHLPERHWTFDDPRTMAELKSKYYEMVLHNDVLSYLTALLRKHSIEVHTEALREVNWATE